MFIMDLRLIAMRIMHRQYMSCACLANRCCFLPLRSTANTSQVLKRGRYEHITPVLHDTLHWLPAQQRIIFKIAVLALHFVRGTCPAYFNDVCVPLAAIPGRTNLRAADRGDRLVPSTKTKIGGLSFCVAALTV